MSRYLVLKKQTPGIEGIQRKFSVVEARNIAEASTEGIVILLIPEEEES